MFHVGQKVVCVDDRWEEDYGRDPVRDQVYVVVETHQDPETGEFYIGVDGVSADHWYSAEWFRPIVENSTDISIFTDILKTVETPPREKVGG